MSAFNRGTSYQLSRRRRRLGALFHARRPSHADRSMRPRASSPLSNASPFFETRSCTCQRITAPSPRTEKFPFYHFLRSMTAKTSEFSVQRSIIKHYRTICFSLSCFRSTFPPFHSSTTRHASRNSCTFGIIILFSLKRI